MCTVGLTVGKLIAVMCIPCVCPNCRDSVVDIATLCLLDDQGIESVGGPDFPCCTNRLQNFFNHLYHGYWVSFPMAKLPSHGYYHTPPSSAECE
jgi:hypothetical protein